MSASHHPCQQSVFTLMPRAPGMAPLAMPLSRESILDLLAHNDRALMRAIVALYRRQLADEQARGQTTVRNGMGFTSADARFGTTCAQWILRNPEVQVFPLAAEWRAPQGHTTRIGKYATQLLAIAHERATKKALEQLSLP